MGKIFLNFNVLDKYLKDEQKKDFKTEKIRTNIYNKYMDNRFKYLIDLDD